MEQRYDAVVLAGGAGRRMGGRDKVTARVHGHTLLDRVLTACQGAERTVVVGPRRPAAREVLWTRETPPGGGPVAAIAAGLARLATGKGSDTPTVLVLAADLPFLIPATLEALVAATHSHDGAVLVDADGRPQPLVAAYQRRALAQALAAIGPPAGRSVRRLVAGLDLTTLPDRASVAFDCDSWADLRQARRRAASSADQRMAAPASARARHGRAEGIGDMLDEWVAAVGAELGVDPDVDVRALLDMARVVAHNVDRPAAPLTTFLVGYAAAKVGGGDRAAIERAARQVAELAEGWAPPAGQPRPDEPATGHSPAGPASAGLGTPPDVESRG